MVGWIKTYHGIKRTTFYVRLRWEGVCYSLRYDKNGDRFESEAHAKRFQAFISELIDAGDFDPNDWLQPRAKSYGAMSRLYMKEQEERQGRGDISPSTLVEKERFMRLYFLPAFKDLDVKKLSKASTVTSFFQGLPKHLSAKSRINIRIELAYILRWLFEQDEIDRIPPLPKIKWKRKIPEYMSEEEWARVIQHIPDHDRPFFETCRIYGMRPGETCALRWEDFDWRPTEEAPLGTFTVRRTLSYGPNGWECIDFTKGGYERVLPIIPRFARILTKLDRKLGGYVFVPLGHADHYEKGRYNRIWRKACTASGVVPRSLYNSTRHTLVCDILRAGGSYEEAGAVVGHRDPRTTRHYGRIFVRQKADVIQLRGRRNE